MVDNPSIIIIETTETGVWPTLELENQLLLKQRLKAKKMKKIETKIRTVSIADLKVHDFLSKYGLYKIKQFEADQLLKFNLPPGHIIATEDLSVLYNWEAVLTAKLMGLKQIEVCVIVGLDDDEVIQVVVFKNMRRILSKVQQAELITELRWYMNETELGKIWKAEVPGDSILEKIGYLIGYSYGMINQIERIYKYRPDLLTKIDEGEMTFTAALAAITPSKDEPEEDEGEPTDGEGAPDEPNGPGLDSSGECEDEQPEKSPEKVPIPKRYAGQNKMESCEPIVGIIVKYASGAEIEIDASSQNAAVIHKGRQLEGFRYHGGLTHPEHNSEFHCISTDKDKRGFELTMWNIDKEAA